MRFIEGGILLTPLAFYYEFDIEGSAAKHVRREIHAERGSFFFVQGEHSKKFWLYEPKVFPICQSSDLPLPITGITETNLLFQLIPLKLTYCFSYVAECDIKI